MNHINATSCGRITATGPQIIGNNHNMLRFSSNQALIVAHAADSCPEKSYFINISRLLIVLLVLMVVAIVVSIPRFPEIVPVLQWQMGGVL